MAEVSTLTQFQDSLTPVVPLSGNQHAVNPDDWATNYWLMSCASKSKNTLRSYQKEVIRWRAFLLSLHGLHATSSMTTASYDDAAKFIAWISSENEIPIPPEVAARFSLNGKQAAKPKASQVVLRQAVIILHGMYEELCAANVPDRTPAQMCCAFNPFKPFRKQYERSKGLTRASGPEASGVAKALSDEAWQAAWEACTADQENATGTAKRKAARRRLVLALLRATWERRHAVAGMLWKDLQRDRTGGWSVSRERKGKGVQWAALPKQVIHEITNFRAAMGRSAVPHPDELQKSIFWLGGATAGHKGPISDETIYRDVKQTFDMAANALESAGKNDVASELRRAGTGPHTIRHTMATQFMAAGGEARVAMEILGHSTLAVTTATYDSRSKDEERSALEMQWQRSV